MSVLIVHSPEQWPADVLLDRKRPPVYRPVNSSEQRAAPNVTVWPIDMLYVLYHSLITEFKTILFPTDLGDFKFAMNVAWAEGLLIKGWTH